MRTPVHRLSRFDNESDPWFRPVWEDEPADDGNGPPGMFARTGPGAVGGLDVPATLAPQLLTPVADASAALARLDARLEAADPAVADGLRARLALREAAGWLAHQHGTWVHPVDLGLRDAGLTGSVTAASMRGRLRTVLPSTLGEPARTEAAVAAPAAEDTAIALALQFARLWLRLAEHRSWAPLADPTAFTELLATLGHHAPAEDAVAAWRDRFAGRPAAGDPSPILLRAGLAAQAWAANEPGEGRGDHLPTAALFLAACLWRHAGSTPALALPLWSATPRQLSALGRLSGPDWLAGFLGVVTDAAWRAGQDLSRLQIAATRAAALRRTARSRLPATATLALRHPVLTASGLAARLRITPQAALILLKQLVGAGVLREATGRAAWRAFVVA
jgi:hypothetical protein